MQPEIISLGEVILEFNIIEKDILAGDGHISIWSAGDISNFSIAASRLGLSVGLLARLGNDYFGKLFIKLMNFEEIDTSHIEYDNDVSLRVSFVDLKESENSFSDFNKNVAAGRMTTGSIDHPYIQNAKLLHISGNSQAISSSACDSVFAAIKSSIDAGRMISYSPNLSLKFWSIEQARAIIHETIAMADIVFLKIEDARALTGFKEPKHIINFYLGFERPQIAVLKLADQNYLLAEKEMIDGINISEIKEYSPFKVNSIDVSGADDTFDAAFVVAYLNGKKPHESCLFANAAAALTTTKKGCIRSIPNLSEVINFLQTKTQLEKK